MKMEVWKPVLGYEGLYEVSNWGRVKSVKYTKRGKNHILSSVKGNYLRVNLYKGKKGKQFLIHRLVYEAFNGKIPSNMQINHIDENRWNNNLDNLELVSCKENANWGTRNERTKAKNTNGRLSKPILQYSLEGVLIKEWPSAREIERCLKINHGNIVKCCHGIRNNSHNYIWRYKDCL